MADDDGIFMDPAVMILELNDWLRRRVRFEQRKVERLADLPAKLVFDFVGLGRVAGCAHADSSRTVKWDKSSAPRHALP